MPEAYQVLTALHETVAKAVVSAGLDDGFVELVRLRVSQINGCVLCTDLHSRLARSFGEPDERLDLLAVWPEAPCYSAAERAAFELAEAITLIAGDRVPDDTYRAVAAHLTERQIAVLTWVTAVVNAYNRLAVTSRAGTAN
jgi:AhpD family alkylhydroperoxidase